MLKPECRDPYFVLDPLLRALEMSSDSVEVDDTGGSIIFVNDAWRRLFDRQRQEVIGVRWDALQFDEIDSAELYASMARCIADGHSEGVFRIRRSGGAGMTVFYTRALYRNADGAAIAVMTIYRPLSRALTVERIPPLLISALNRSAYGIAVADAFGYLINANEEFIDLVGYSKGEIPRLHLRSLFPGSDEMLSSIDEGESRWNYETRIKRKDGSATPVSLSITPSKDTHEVTVGFVVRIRPLPGA